MAHPPPVGFSDHARGNPRFPCQNRRLVPQDQVRESMGDYLDEEERIEKLRGLVDELCQRIRGGKLTLSEANKEAALVRLKAERLIPFEMDRFDLIYGARLKRMIEQFLQTKPKEDSSK
jgi:hypothetical protein